jgi:hypothetical protein
MAMIFLTERVWQSGTVCAGLVAMPLQPGALRGFLEAKAAGHSSKRPLYSLILKKNSMAKSTVKQMTKSAIVDHLASENEMTKKQATAVMECLVSLAYREEGIHDSGSRQTRMLRA